MIPKGGTKCIAYNPNHQAATLDEALAFFKDTIADPENAEPVSGAVAENIKTGRKVSRNLFIPIQNSVLSVWRIFSAVLDVKHVKGFL